MLKMPAEILSALKMRNADVQKGTLRLGTSGIVIPGAKATYPQQFQNKSRIHYYATLFNTVEVNSSFYKVPMRKTFEKWALDVPDDFQFTVKLWRGITHVKDLNFDIQAINQFIDAADGLGFKKGCLLIQFPASVHANQKERVKAILERLASLDLDCQWRLAIEFRHTSWYTADIFKLLHTYQASLVLHDMPKSKVIVDETLAKFVYMRFHGPTGDYKGSYTTDLLQQRAASIQHWLTKGKDVYVYFNNTVGNAFENSQTLLKLVGQAI